MEKNPKNLEKKDQIPAKENEMLKNVLIATFLKMSTVFILHYHPPFPLQMSDVVLKQDMEWEEVKSSLDGAIPRQKKTNMVLGFPNGRSMNFEYTQQVRSAFP